MLHSVKYWYPATLSSYVLHSSQYTYVIHGYQTTNAS